MKIKLFLGVLMIALGISPRPVLGQGLDQAIFFMRQQVRSLLEQNENLISQRNALQKNLLQLRDLARSKENELEEMNRMIINYQAQLDNQEEYALRLQSENAALEQDIKKAEQAQESLRLETSRHQDAVSQLQRERDKIVLEIDEANLWLKDSQGVDEVQRTLLKQQIAGLEQEIQSVELGNEDLRQRIDQQEQRRLALSQEIKEQEENMQNLVSALLIAEENYQAQESLLKDLEGGKLSALSAANQVRAASLEKRQSLSQQIKILEKKIAQTDREITQARGARRQATALTEDKIQKKIVDARFENLLLTHQVLALHNDIDKMKKDIETLRNVLHSQVDTSYPPKVTFEKSLSPSPSVSTTFAPEKKPLKIPDILQDL